MTWAKRYRLKQSLRQSVWPLPLLSIPTAILAAQFLLWLDRTMGWTLELGIDNAHSVIGTVTSSLLTFIGLVLTVLLVAVQLASVQMTPRIISLVFADRVTKLALSFFVFTYSFCLVVMSRMQEPIPLVTSYIAAYAGIACLGAFLLFVDHMGKWLRPVALLARVAATGREVIRNVYPIRYGEAPPGVARSEDVSAQRATREIGQTASGVLLGFDEAGLVRLAKSAGCIVELVPQVGDFVAPGDILFRTYGGGDSIPEEVLRGSVAFGASRSMDQDPGYAFRIVVDIAAKALSASINDPTTAVHAMDQLHHLLRMAGFRNLDTGYVRDGEGRLRLVYRTPDWEDYVALSVVEIRQYGAGSIQVVRRLRAMLHNLISVLPLERAPALRRELEVLDQAVVRSFHGTRDQSMAAKGDAQGIGGAE